MLSMFVIHVSNGENSTGDSSVTTESPAEECTKHSGGTCKDCIENVKCFYCEKTKNCEIYPYKTIVPKAKDCSMSDIRWGTCFINFLALIISCSVIGGILLISIIICCCCCCCCKKKRPAAITKLEMKWQREKEERKVRGEERRAERKTRTDEIRRKYGLIKEDNPYERFEA
ncbi:Pituitary tumor-transforming protein 1 protein-interacting protein [Nymphon striatum]|nr:Pituitary tumor-transforming protein 1 protein-interacting protein [Nymphon striatum]